jgi:hypothetical protein
MPEGEESPADHVVKEAPRGGGRVGRRVSPPDGVVPPPSLGTGVAVFTGCGAAGRRARRWEWCSSADTRLPLQEIGRGAAIALQFSRLGAGGTGVGGSTIAGTSVGAAVAVADGGCCRGLGVLVSPRSTCCCCRLREAEPRAHQRGQHQARRRLRTPEPRLLVELATDRMGACCHRHRYWQR